MYNYVYIMHFISESSLKFYVEQQDIKFMNNLTVRKGLNFLHQPVCQFTVCITLTSFFTPCTKLSSIVESFMNLAACISKFVHKYFCLFVWLEFFEFFVPVEIFSLIWRRPHYRLRAANFDLWHLWLLSSEGSLACHT